MLIKGLTQSEEQIVKSILEPYMNKYKFYFYGSRVKGNFRPMSDLDILVKGNSAIEISEIENLKTEFDNSRLPFVVNFSDFHSMDKDFYKIIEDDLVQL